MSHLLLYGGTFDPVHHGHLIPCRRARELLGADVVVLIPARVSPHKTDRARMATTTPEQRLAMLRLAVEGDQGFAIDARELGRRGPSFTADTLRELAGERPGDRLTLLIGADQLRLFGTWRDIHEILRLAEVRVMARPQASTAAGLDLLRGQLGEEAAARVRPLDTPLVDISATGIRERMAAGLPVRYLVPDAVADFLRREGLYQTAATDAARE